MVCLSARADGDADDEEDAAAANWNGNNWVVPSTTADASGYNFQSSVMIVSVVVDDDDAGDPLLSLLDRSSAKCSGNDPCSRRWLLMTADDGEDEASSRAVLDVLMYFINSHDL